ncbi:EpsG family protein [Megasphaera cerevisiae]|nr:EpsG family protein [Megasphaera cerevisiae]
MFSLCIIALLFNDILKNKKEKDIVVIITLIFLCIVSGTRYQLGGTDYWVYENIFNRVPDLIHESFFSISDNLLAKYEIGYLFFNSIVKTVGFTFYGFTLINSIIFYTCMYTGLRKYVDNFSLLIIVFLYKMFFYDTFISMRQSISIAIFFVILKYIQERQAFKYFVGCIIAMLFHNAAIILFPIYFINRFSLTMKKTIFLNMVFLPTILISYLHLSVLNFLIPIAQYIPVDSTQTKVANYFMNMNDLMGINLLHTLEYFLIMFLIVINYKKIISINKNSEFIIKLFLCLLPIFTLLREYDILTREKDFFTLTFAIILGYLCQINDKRQKILVQLGTIIICAYGFFRFILLFDDGGMMPYISCLFENVSIFQ